MCGFQSWLWNDASVIHIKCILPCCHIGILLEKFQCCRSWWFWTFQTAAADERLCLQYDWLECYWVVGENNMGLQEKAVRFIRNNVLICLLWITSVLTVTTLEDVLFHSLIIHLVLDSIQLWNWFIYYLYKIYPIVYVDVVNVWIYCIVNE